MCLLAAIFVFSLHACPHKCYHTIQTGTGAWHNWPLSRDIEIEVFLIGVRIVSASHILSGVSVFSGNGDEASCAAEDCQAVSTLRHTLSTCALSSDFHACPSYVLTGIWHSDGRNSKGTVQSQVAQLYQHGASFVVLRGWIVSALHKGEKEKNVVTNTQNPFGKVGKEKHTVEKTKNKAMSSFSVEQHNQLFRWCNIKQGVALQAIKDYLWKQTTNFWGLVQCAVRNNWWNTVAHVASNGCHKKAT